MVVTWRDVVVATRVVVPCLAVVGVMFGITGTAVVDGGVDPVGSAALPPHDPTALATIKAITRFRRSPKARPPVDDPEMLPATG